MFLFKYFFGFSSIFLIAFATGEEAASIIKYPAALEDSDFAQAYFLFSLSVFGVDQMASGRATVESAKDAVAPNREPFSAANSSPFFKSLESYTPLNAILLFVFELIFIYFN